MYEPDDSEELEQQDDLEEVEPTDEEVESEDVPDDEEGGEEDGDIEDLAEVGDDWRIEIPVAEDETVTLDANELRQVVERGRNYEALAERYRQLESSVQTQRGLAEYVAKDPLISGLIQHRYHNGDDATFLRQYLGTAMSQNSQQVEEQLGDLDPEVEKVINAKFLKPLAEKNRELEEKLSRMANEQTQREIANHNSQIMDQAITEYGIAWEGTEEQAKALRSAKELLYPELDLTVNKLNKAQVLALFAQAQIPQKKQASSVKKTDVLRAGAKTASKAPKVMAGTKGQGRVGQKNGKSSSEAVSRQERLQNFKELFG